jgi:hypothetical protein
MDVGGVAEITLGTGSGQSWNFESKEDDSSFVAVAAAQ